MCLLLFTHGTIVVVLTIYENIPSPPFWAILLPSVKLVFVFQIISLTPSSHSVAQVYTCRTFRETKVFCVCFFNLSGYSTHLSVLFNSTMQLFTKGLK